MPHERRHGPYQLSDERTRIDIDAVHRYLSTESYWAAGRPHAAVARSIAHALCIAAYAPDGSLAGFAKLITDYAVSAHLNDVFVLPAHRGQGLGAAIVNTALHHPALTWITTWHLRTRDAHGLYARFGFEVFDDTGHTMRLRKLPPDFSIPPVDANPGAA